MTEADVQHAYLEALAVDALAERYELERAEAEILRRSRGLAYQDRLRVRFCSPKKETP